MVGATEDDLDREEGASDEERELEWLCMAVELPDRINGGRSLTEGGEIDLLWLFDR